MYFLFFIFSCSKENNPPSNNPPSDTTGTNPVDTTSHPPQSSDENILLGNPSDAQSDVNDYDNYLMSKSYYTLSYNRDKSTANWVCWHLDASDIGSVSRQDDYRADNSLPSGWYEVNETSFSGSGFDRGHCCPSGDRTGSNEMNDAVFLMTNMIPQAPYNNQFTWSNFENYTRSLVQQGNECYIIMGAYGEGGSGNNGFYTKIDNGHVTVPAQIWKVVVVLQQGSNDLSRIDSTTRVIAINTPNTNSVNADWHSYRTTVDAIEAATGYDLLSKLPANIQSYLEATVDNR